MDQTAFIVEKALYSEVCLVSLLSVSHRGGLASESRRPGVSPCLCLPAPSALSDHDCLSSTRGIVCLRHALLLLPPILNLGRGSPTACLSPDDFSSQSWAFSGISGGRKGPWLIGEGLVPTQRPSSKISPRDGMKIQYSTAHRTRGVVMSQAGIFPDRGQCRPLLGPFVHCR